MESNKEYVLNDKDVFYLVQHCLFDPIHFLIA